MGEILNNAASTVFITGASRGLGRLIAEYMADHVSTLLVHARKLSHLENLIEHLKARGKKVEAIAADLSDPASVSAMLDEIENRGLKIDILFNNAAIQIAYRSDPFETPVEDFTESFMVNTIAPAMIVYRLLPAMISRNFGRIINVTSGISGEPEQAGYSASKAALDKITLDLEKLISGKDIAISLVDPGWCRTDLGGPQAPNAPESALPGMVLGAFLSAEKSGRLIRAQEFTGLSLKEAIGQI